MCVQYTDKHTQKMSLPSITVIKNINRIFFLCIDINQLKFYDISNANFEVKFILKQTASEKLIRPVKFQYPHQRLTEIQRAGRFVNTSN